MCYKHSKLGKAYYLKPEIWLSYSLNALLSYLVFATLKFKPNICWSPSKSTGFNQLTTLSTMSIQNLTLHIDLIHPWFCPLYLIRQKYLNFETQIDYEEIYVVANIRHCLFSSMSLWLWTKRRWMCNLWKRILSAISRTWGLCTLPRGIHHNI